MKTTIDANQVPTSSWGLISDLPEYLYPPEELFDTDVERIMLLNLIWVMCANECNLDYGGRTHGNVRTYNEGCRGPICRSANRADYQKKNDKQPRGIYIWLDPIIYEYKERLDSLERAWMDKLQIARVTGHITEDVGIIPVIEEQYIDPELFALLDKESPNN